MSWVRVIGFCVAATTASGQATKSPLPLEIADDAYELCSSILKSQSGRKEAVAVDVASITPTQMGRAEPASSEEREMFQSFRKLAEGHYVWEARFKIGRPYVFVTEEGIPKLLASCRPDPVGCPKRAKIRSVIHISGPGFNATHTRALVWIEHFCGGLCGGGSLVVYRKESGTWKEEENGIRTVVVY